MSRDDEPPSLGGRLLGLFIDNWTLKLAALLVSLFAYVLLHAGGESQRTLEVDLLRGVDQDSSKVLLTPLPSRIHVTVQGPRALLDDLPNPIDAISLDLSAHPTVLRLSDHPLKLPPGVRRLALSPSALSLRWDTKVQRRLKVELVAGTPAEGLTIKAGSVIVSPPTALLSGPKTRVDAVQRLLTATLELKDRKAGFHVQTLFLDKTPEGLADGSVTLDPEQVEVRFELTTETKTRSFTNLPVLLLKGKGATIRPHTVSVVVTCPPKRADELKEDTVVPKIDLEALGVDFAKKGAEEAEIKVEVPGCSEVIVSPTKVAITR